VATVRAASQRRIADNCCSTNIVAASFLALRSRVPAG
jgi:hypothetical protein